MTGRDSGAAESGATAQPVPGHIQDLYAESRQEYTEWLAGGEKEDAFFTDDDTIPPDRFLDAFECVVDACEREHPGVGKAVARKARIDFTPLIENAALRLLINRLEGGNRGPASGAADDMGPPPDVRLAVEGVTVSSGPPRARFGDVLVLDDSVVFLSYGVSHSSLPAYILFGAIKGAAEDWRERLRLEGFTRVWRARTYGSTVSERAAELEWSTVTEMAASMAYDDASSSIVCTSAAGQRTSFRVRGLSASERAVIDRFPARDVCAYPLEDPYGLRLQVPSPRKLVQSLARRSAGSSVLEQVAGNPAYMIALYYRIASAPQEHLDDLLDSLTETPSAFREALLGLAERYAARSPAAETELVEVSENRFAGVLLGVMLSMLVLLVILNTLNVATCGVCLAVLFGVPAMFQPGRRRRRFARRVIQSLGGESP